MWPSAPRVCSEPGGQKSVLLLSLDLIVSLLSPAQNVKTTGPLSKTLINPLWPNNAIWLNHGLSPNGTIPLSKPILISHWWNSVAFTRGQFHSECPGHYYVSWVWKLCFENYCLISTGASELRANEIRKNSSWRWNSENKLIYLCFWCTEFYVWDAVSILTTP